MSEDRIRASGRTEAVLLAKHRCKSSLRIPAVNFFADVWRRGHNGEDV